VEWNGVLQVLGHERMEAGLLNKRLMSANRRGQNDGEAGDGVRYAPSHLRDEN